MARAAASASGQNGKPPSPRVASLLREIACELSGHADDIALTMTRACAAEIPAYSQIADVALQADVRAVSAALVRCWLTVLPTGQPVHADLLRPITEGARRRAAQGMDLPSLLRAYRAGIRVMWNEITTTPAWRGRVPPSVLAREAARILDFSDQICTAVTAAHTDESTHVTRGPEYRRSALLSAILADPDPEHLTAPDELSLPHCAAVARVGPDLPLDQMTEIGRALVRQAGGLWTIRYGTVVAAIPLPVPAGRDKLRQRLAGLIRAGPITGIGIGGRSASVADTRASYREAVSALDIGSRLGAGGHAVYEYQEFAPLIALMAQPDQARRFTAAALEPLGGLASRSWALPTLEAYLARQGHLKEVAAALAVHLNTVKYRLRQLHPCIDSSLSDGDRATAMLLALRARRLLAETGADQAPLPSTSRRQAPPTAFVLPNNRAPAQQDPGRPRNLPGRRADTHP